MRRRIRQSIEFFNFTFRDNCLFIFEDEMVTIPEGEQAKFDTLPPEYSQLYLAIDGVLSAVICISDPLREEAKDVLSALRGLGVKNAVTALIRKINK